MTEFQDPALVGGGRFSLLLVFRAVPSTLSRETRHHGFVGGAYRKEGCLGPGAEAVGKTQVLVRVMGLLSFLEKRGAHGELRPRSLTTDDRSGDRGAGSGAGSISLSNQASIFRICGGTSGADS